jgi:hypothetical protein
MSRGEDPMGLGRWSYIILRGKGSKKIAIITAYNVSPSRGDTTANQQQTRLLSSYIRQNNLPISAHPHRQFILDLQSWIETLIQEGHEIILALDANETYNPEVPVPPHKLVHKLGQLTLDKHHDGKLATLVSTCGLKDPLAVQHPERPFPPSYFRGTNRIDFILVTPNLMGAVLCTGSLPLYSLMQGDHLPYYVDLDASTAFADSAYEIQRPVGRCLKLHDPRIVERYKDYLYEQISYHKILEKHEALKAISEAGKWTPEATALYQTLDGIITRVMITAERKAGTTYSTKYDWSPTLKALVQAHRFWKLKFKHSKGQAVATGTLQHTLDESNLSQEALQVTSQAKIIEGMRSTYQSMITHRKQHKELRASHSEQLAEAIVLHRSPNLHHESAQHIREELKLEVLKQISTRENIRRSYPEPPSTHGLKSCGYPRRQCQGPEPG